MPPEGLRTPRPISSIDRLYYEFVLLSSSHGCVKGSRQKDQSIPAHRDRQAAWLMYPLRAVSAVYPLRGVRKLVADQIELDPVLQECLQAGQDDSEAGG